MKKFSRSTASRVVATAAVCIGLLAGTATQANAAPISAAVHEQGVDLGTPALDVTKAGLLSVTGIPPFPAKKVAAFAGCVFGVGVPIGLAVGFATNPGVWAYVAGVGPLPASAGGAAWNYINLVKRACSYALR